MPLVAAALLLLASSNSNGNRLFGDWLSPEKSIVRVYGCGHEVCLKIVQLAPSVAKLTDAQNPEPALRSRQLCGLQIGSGFHQDDDQRAVNGQLYDPKSGKTYHGSMQADGNLLKLRGYLGVPLFGRTETWQRASTPPQGCSR
jgi:uncharacterized protein (DUF2147 family)